jgi:hypothetical protein
MNTLRPARLFPRLGAIATAMVLPLVCLTPARADDHNSCQSPGVVGAYLFDGTIDSGIPGLPGFLTPGLEVQGVFTLHDDGTVVMRHNFGPPTHGIEPGIGAWKREGRDGIKIVYVFFNVPRQTDPASTTPELGILIDRVTMHLTRDHPSGILEGSLINEVFLPSQDPLDPASVPVASVLGTIVGARRILP